MFTHNVNKFLYLIRVFHKMYVFSNFLIRLPLSFFTCWNRKCLMMNHEYHTLLVYPSADNGEHFIMSERYFDSARYLYRYLCSTVDRIGSQPNTGAFKGKNMQCHCPNHNCWKQSTPTHGRAVLPVRNFSFPQDVTEEFPPNQVKSPILTLKFVSLG